MIAPKDVFDFTSLRRLRRTSRCRVCDATRRGTARNWPTAIYELTSDRILIFVHGSSYHGAGYHGLAAVLSFGGVAKVVLPNCVGTISLARHRGDVEYIGSSKTTSPI